MQVKDFAEYSNEITLHLWKHTLDVGRSNPECCWPGSVLICFWKLRINSPVLVELFQVYANITEGIASSLKSCCLNSDAESVIY